MAIKMMRKCKKKEEITMKKSKKMASHFARSSFCFYKRLHSFWVNTN